MTIKHLMMIAALALVGCTGEMGAEIGDGFGESNRNNTLAMTNPRDFAISMTRKFAAEAPNTVHFAFNSAVLDGTAQAELAQQAAWINSHPQVRFRVYGHTDLVGSDNYNKALGLRRAQAVVSYLVAHGVSRARLEAVVSFGKTQPLVYTPAPNERNRRTVTEVSGLAAAPPTPMNGKYAKVVFDEYVRSAQPAPAIDLGTVRGGVGNDTAVAD